MWGEIDSYIKPDSPAHCETQSAGIEYEDKMDQDASEPSTPTAQVRGFLNLHFMFNNTKPQLSKYNIPVALAPAFSSLFPTSDSVRRLQPSGCHDISHSGQWQSHKEPAAGRT